MKASYVFETITGEIGCRKTQSHVESLPDRDDSEAMRRAHEYCQERNLPYAHVSFFDREDGVVVLIGTARREPQ